MITSQQHNNEELDALDIDSILEDDNAEFEAVLQDKPMMSSPAKDGVVRDTDEASDGGETEADKLEFVVSEVDQLKRELTDALQLADSYRKQLATAKAEAGMWKQKFQELQNKEEEAWVQRQEEMAKKVAAEEAVKAAAAMPAPVPQIAATPSTMPTFEATPAAAPAAPKVEVAVAADPFGDASDPFACLGPTFSVPTAAPAVVPVTLPADISEPATPKEFASPSSMSFFDMDMNMDDMDDGEEDDEDEEEDDDNDDEEDDDDDDGDDAEVVVVKAPAAKDEEDDEDEEDEEDSEEEEEEQEKKAKKSSKKSSKKEEKKTKKKEKKSKKTKKTKKSKSESEDSEESDEDSEEDSSSKKKSKKEKKGKKEKKEKKEKKAKKSKKKKDVYGEAMNAEAQRQLAQNVQSQYQLTLRHYHDFEVASFATPTSCDACGKMLIGLWKQGFSCGACNMMTCHEACMHLPVMCQPNADTCRVGGAKGAVVIQGAAPLNMGASSPPAPAPGMGGGQAHQMRTPFGAQPGGNASQYR
jgi:hypothetical protein